MFSPDTDPAVVRALMGLQSVNMGEGYPSPAETGDTVYQNVYAINTAGTWVLYGGKPTDPRNPDVITVSAAGSATLLFEEEGTPVGAGFGTVNFVGAAVTVTDGGTKAVVTIVAAPNAFATISVSGSSDVVADGPADVLTLVAGAYFDITQVAGTDTITFAVNLTTDVPGYNAGANQYLKNEAGTIKWVTVGAC